MEPLALEREVAAVPNRLAIGRLGRSAQVGLQLDPRRERS